ncbi:MAG: hypothetical protein EBU76_06890, partial [Gammaproteobacteria bacterium]|nr:hypothetical protein [Gammaproteobacteria bacterium]
MIDLYHSQYSNIGIKESAALPRYNGSEEQSRAVTRLFSVLDQLSVAPQPVSNLDLSRATGAPPSSTHRLLGKICELGYLARDPYTATYIVTPLLTELASRLAQAGGHSPALLGLMKALRDLTGGTVSVSSHAPGEIREPFSTPGLALASSQPQEEIKRLFVQARRHRVPLGRRFRTLREVQGAIAQVVQRGYAEGFNLRSDGWGLLAWPIPLGGTPSRPSAIAVGLPVGELRRRQRVIV